MVIAPRAPGPSRPTRGRPADTCNIGWL